VATDKEEVEDKAQQGWNKPVEEGVAAFPQVAVIVQTSIQPLKQDEKRSLPAHSAEKYSRYDQIFSTTSQGGFQ
jgi:hypothetical protein